MESYPLLMPAATPLKINYFVLFQSKLDSFYQFAYFHIMVVFNTYLINFNLVFFINLKSINYLISYLLSCDLGACVRLMGISIESIVSRDFGKSFTGCRLEPDGSQIGRELRVDTLIKLKVDSLMRKTGHSSKVLFLIHTSMVHLTSHKSKVQQLVAYLLAKVLQLVHFTRKLQAFEF